MVSSAVLQTRAPDDQNTRKSDVKWYVGKLQGQLNEMQAAMGISTPPMVAVRFGRFGIV